jgi:hypothetical protein
MADHKHKISGPGAADFLTAQGGIDFPELTPVKGTGILREETHFTDARNLEPAIAPEDEVRARDRTNTPDEMTGSQTGTIGGGGAEAHNPDPVRATGEDDPTVPRDPDETR